MGTNDGAYMQIVSAAENPSATTVEGTNLSFNVFRYNISSEFSVKKPNVQALNLQGLLISKLTVLRRAFEAADVLNDYMISIENWAAIMSSVTKIKIRWIAMAHRLVPTDAFNGDLINYEIFLAAVSSTDEENSSDALKLEV